jgi:hypothetical protein
VVEAAPRAALEQELSPTDLVALDDTRCMRGRLTDAGAATIDGARISLRKAVTAARSTVSKIEHGTRTMPEALWKTADELCHAEGGAGG